MAQLARLPLWRESAAEFMAQVSATPATLKIVLKTKDEGYFLERWIAHHANIVGLENLIIVDNMSSDERVLEIYRRYQSRVPIVQFDGFYDTLHDIDTVPELYRGFEQSCTFFMLLDTDEFLVEIKGDTYSADARILDTLARETRDAFPGSWLMNVPGSATRFRTGKWLWEFAPTVAWGKPIVRSSKYNVALGGNLNHNVDVDGGVYAGDVRTQFFVLHMKNLDARQRIDVNISKLIARGLASPGETVASILSRHLDGTRDPYNRSMLKELRQLAAPADTSASANAADDSWLELTTDGRVLYSGTREAAAMHAFLTKSQHLCRVILQTDGRDLRARSDFHWGRWKEVFDWSERTNRVAEAGTVLASPMTRRDDSRAVAPDATRHTGASRRSRAVCLTGLRGSGHSLIARLLNRAGLHLGEASELKGATSDSDSVFEHRRFVTLNDEVLNEIGGAWDHPVGWPSGWIRNPRLAALKRDATALVGEFREFPSWGWSDPRNSLTLPFWQNVAGPIKVVLCVRHPLEAVLAVRSGRPMSAALGLHLWQTYNERVLRDTRPADRLVTHYDALSTHAEEEAARLLTFVGLEPSRAAIDACKTAIAGRPGQQPVTNADLAAAELAPDLIDLYERLLAEAGRPQDLALAAAKPRGRSPRGRVAEPTGGVRRVNPLVLDVLNESRDLKMALAAKDAALAAKDASISIREATYQEMLIELKGLREELRRERERREELEVDEGLAYEQLKRRVYDLLDDTIPQGATVLVVSGGDDGFVHLNGREVWHFPRTEDGLWNGQPGTSQDAIDQLEAIRATTTAYLVFPLPEFWWLDFYRELAAYLHERCEVLVNRVNAAVVFTLSAREGARPSGERAAT